MWNDLSGADSIGWIDIRYPIVVRSLVTWNYYGNELFLIHCNGGNLKLNNAMPSLAPSLQDGPREQPLKLHFLVSEKLCFRYEIFELIQTSLGRCTASSYIHAALTAAVHSVLCSVVMISLQWARQPCSGLLLPSSHWVWRNAGQVRGSDWSKHL